MEGLPRSDRSNQSTRILRRVFASRAFGCGFGRESLVPAAWAWDECAASTLSHRPGRRRARIMPVARTRARSAPAGRREPTARRGRVPRYHRLRIENSLASSFDLPCQSVCQLLRSNRGRALRGATGVDANVHPHPSTTAIGPWSRGTLTPYVMPISNRDELSRLVRFRERLQVNPRDSNADL